jgi:dTDP-4-amino-4,6-dideoxy-D-galactose acyltransferase
MSQPSCRFLDWDSAFFGIRIARVELPSLTALQMEDVLQWCQENQIRCLYFLCPFDHRDSVRLAEMYQFQLVGIKTVLAWEKSRDLTPQPQTKQPFLVRPFQTADLQALIDIAGDAFQDSRFSVDSHFASGQASALYREWIRKSCQGSGDQVFVSQNPWGVAGFITCHLDPEPAGRIGLIAVKKESRDAGHGGALIETANHYFVEHHCHRVYVTTQGQNVPAFRLYQKCGFYLHSLHLWYHKWFPEERLIDA